MDLYEKNGNVVYILNVLKKYSDYEHVMKVTEIREKIIEEYNVEIDTRTIRRNINLLKYKLNYDISTREENGKGYYYITNPEMDFEPGELRVIIDVFNYSDYIVSSIADQIIAKCKNMQSIYENKKIENYKVFAKNRKTKNMEVIKNVEDIAKAIMLKKKIRFEYFKFSIDNGKLEEIIVSTPTISPYVIVYDMQELYIVALKEGKDKLYHYRLDRIKNIEILENEVEKKSIEEIEKFTKTSVNLYGGDISEISAICDTSLLNEIMTKFGKNITIKKIDNEKFELILDADINGFYFWALSHLDGVEVISPIEIRNRIKEALIKSQKRYFK